MAVDLAVIGVAFDASQVAEGEKVVARSLGNIEKGADRVTAATERATRTFEAQAQAQKVAGTQAATDLRTSQQRIDATNRLAAAAERGTSADRAAAQAARQQLSVQEQVERALQNRRKAQASLASDTARNLAQSHVAEQERLARVAQMTAADRARASATLRAAAADRQQTEAWVLSAKAARATATATAGVGVASTKAAPGVHRAHSALTQLAISAGGLPGPLGRVIGSLGSLAIGGALSVAVVAGVAAITAAWEHFTKATREARERTEQLVASLVRQREEASGELVAKQATDLRAAVAQANDALARAERGRTFVDRGGIPRTVVDPGKVREAREEVERIQKAVVQFGANQAGVARLSEEATEAIVTGSTRVQESFGSLRDFQQDAAADMAKSSGDAAALIELEYTRRLQAIEEAFTHLSAEGQRTARALHDQWTGVVEAQREADRYGAARVRGGGFTAAPLAIRGIISPDAAQAQFDAADQQRQSDQRKAELARDLAAAEQSYEAALRTTTDAIQRGFEAVFENGAAGFEEFFNSVVGLATNAAASIAAAMTVKALGIDKLVHDITTGEGFQLGQGFTGPGGNRKNAVAGASAGLFAGQLAGNLASNAAGGAGLGALSGAAAGFAVGGPVGAIVGGVTGLVSGLLGAGDKAKEAARRMAEAQKSFTLSLKAYADAASGTSTELSQALIANQAKADDLRKQAGDIFQAQVDAFSPEDFKNGNASRAAKAYADAMAEIDKNSAALTEQLKAEAAVRTIQLKADLHVRGLRAQGRDEEADAEQRRLDHQREYDAAVKAGESAETLALIKQTQIAEDLKVTLDQIAAKAEATRKITEDLAVRNAVVSGDDDEAALLRQQTAQAEEYNRAVAAGVDATTLAAIRETQLAETRKLEADQAKAREESAFAFSMDLLDRRAKLDGDIEGQRLVYLANLKHEQEGQLAAAQRLLDQGVITQDQFDSFSTLLGDEFTSAVNDSSFAVEAAVAKMREALAALNQEFSVFQTSLDDQVKQTGDLFGFGGLSEAQLQDMFTTAAEAAAAGGLTPEQKALNGQIATYLDLDRRADAAHDTGPSASVPSNGSVGANGTVIQGNVVLQIEIRVDSDELRDTERLTERIAARINREFGGRASLLKGAAGRA